MHKTNTERAAAPDAPVSPENPLEAAAPPYEPPALQRVRIETTRLGYGVVDAVNNCTAHSHDDNAGVCS